MWFIRMSSLPLFATSLRRRQPTVNDVTAEHELALGRMMTVAAKIARDEGLADDGYRLIVNCNRHGGQEVYHIHMHLLGGRPLGPMLAHKG